MSVTSRHRGSTRGKVVKTYRIFLRRSKSSRRRPFKLFATAWEFLPVLKSFLRFKNQTGILNCVGFWMIATMRSISSFVSSPARLFRSTSAFLQHMIENRRPQPGMAVKATHVFRRPSILVFKIRRICWKSGVITRLYHTWVSRQYIHLFSITSSLISF